VHPLDVHEAVLAVFVQHAHVLGGQVDELPKQSRILGSVCANICAKVTHTRACIFAQHNKRVFTFGTVKVNFQDILQKAMHPLRRQKKARIRYTLCDCRELSGNFREHSVNFREHSVNFREHSVNFREHSVNFRDMLHTFILIDVPV
jgi:hypothetical protein